MSHTIPATHAPLAARPGRPAHRLLAAVALLATLASASPAVLAATASTSGPEARSASASLDFRIVIPETVRFERGQEQRDRSRQFTSRTVEEVSGRQVVTVARP